MNTEPEVLDLLKALSQADRLKIVGMLVPAPSTLAQISAGLDLSTRDAYNHLESLKYVQIVTETDGSYHLSKDGLEKLSRSQFQGDRQVRAAGPDLDPGLQKSLSAFLAKDGSLRQIPNSRTQVEKFRFVLEYLQAAFEPQVAYSEKQVNAIIQRFHPDSAGLRRDLVDAGLLGRVPDGSRYWRVVPEDK
jgi:hypothetical protein